MKSMGSTCWLRGSPQRATHGGGRAGQPTRNTAQTASFSITGAGAVDASIAYRQLLESDDPYNVKFKERKGTVTVEDAIPIGDDAQPSSPRRQFLLI